MEDTTKKWQWHDCPYVNPEVYQLSQIISSKPTADSLEKLHTYLKDDDNLLRRNDARSLFLYYVAKCNTCKALKNEFMKKITNDRTNFTLFSTIIIESVKDILFDYEIEKTLVSSRNVVYLLPVVNVFFQLCTDRANTKIDEIAEVIVPLYDIIVDTFIRELEADFDEAYTFQNEELIIMSNQALKQLLWIFVKRPEHSIEEYTLSFMDYSYKMLNYDKIGMGMKSKCGLIFIHCLGRMPDEELVNFNFKEHPMLEVVNQPENIEDWICGNSFKYANILNSNSAKVALYSALYNCIPIDNLLGIQVNNQSLFRYLFNEMLNCADRPMSDNAEIIEVSRNLLLMTNTLNKLPAEHLDGIFERSISYINVFSEYHMDAVQKNVSLFLGQLIKLASDHYRNANERFMKYFLRCVNLREAKRKIDFLRIVYICSYMKCSYLLKNVPYLREQLTLLLEDPVCHEQAFGAYELLMKEHCKEISTNEWLDLWVKPALGQLRRVRLDRIPVYQELISRAVEINPVIMKDLFPSRYMGGHREWAILLRSLSHARNSRSYTIGTHGPTSWWGLIEKSKLKMFYVQRDDSIRIAALKVIVECQKTTEFFTEWEFTYMVDFYLLNGCNQIPSVRKQITALFKKAFQRFFAGLEVIKKKIEYFKKKRIPNAAPGENWDDHFTKLKESYRNFLTKFTKYLIGNIAPDGNFYRRTMALDLLMFLQPLVNKNDWNKLWNPDNVENLKQVLLDSYEINKKMAFFILSKFEPKRFKFDDTDYYTSYFSEALTLASDIKPSKSLSAAYMFQLCTYSRKMCPNAKDVTNYRDDNEMVLNIIILLASELLSKFNAETQDADVNSPCYGILLCLRYLIRYRMKSTWNATYASTFSLIYTLCTRVFSIMLPIVSNPAPEGYLPENEETEIQIRDDTVRSQRILVYAWRTIKEVTLLFSEFACQDMELREHHILDPADYFAIGEHFMEIFIQAKHRGVFEQAYVGFCLLCECYWKSPNEELRSLPDKWLRRGLDLVAGKEIDERLCPTRRSAGMPFLILAILTTDPSHDKNSFHVTVAELSKVAGCDDATKIEYKTHALNILRFIFRHTKLGDSVSPYIEKTAELALRGMQSLDWGIRNSSTLLFSALMTRLFGVQRTQDTEEVSVKNKMTVKVFCSKYPKLFDFLLETLKTECLNNNSLILHPVLLVFSRLYPSHLDPSDVKIEEAIPCIRICLSNPSVETRKLAARASMALVLVKDLNRSIIRNFAKIARKRVGNNECHGLLSEVWFIMKYSCGRMDLPASEMISSTIYVLEEAGSKFSHHCVSLYMDILSRLFGNESSRQENRVDLDTLRRILTSISRLMEEQNLNITGRQNFEAAMVNLTITILLMRLEHVETTFQAINYDFENYMMVNEGIIMKTYCLYFILYINITYNEYDLQDPPLMLLDELKIPETVRDVINNFSKPTQCEFLMYIHKFIVTYLKGEIQRTDPVPNECYVLNLLILPYYPCVLASLNDGDKQKTLDMLINCCSCDREEVISAVITCISVLIAQLDTDALRTLDYKRLIRLLRKSAAPDAAVHRRMSVCQFMLKCKYLFYFGPKFMGVHSLMHFFCIVITLLEDEALKIRNEMSAVTDDHNVVLIDEESKCGWKCTPDKSRYDFLKHCCKVLPKQFGVALLFGWTIRHFPDTSNDASDVFERSQMNSYAENIPYLHMAAKILHVTLWSIPYDLSYADKSIFIEEQCQMATTILLDAVHGFSFPMVNRKTKVSVICALKSILTYLDINRVSPNFKPKFTEYFQKKILLYFRRQVCQKDFPSVRRVFLHLYNPVLIESELWK